MFAAPGLDFETTTLYSLGVAATDQSLDPRDRQTTICTVEIELVDANDNAPVFSNSLYESTIIENATMGTVVTVVSAEDIDSDQNAEVFYLFQSPISEWACVSVCVCETEARDCGSEDTVSEVGPSKKVTFQ